MQNGGCKKCSKKGFSWLFISSFRLNRVLLHEKIYNQTENTRKMKMSLLQQARAQYQPKLPKGLQGAVKVKEGEPTQSVGNQDEIKKLFPNTYGMPLIEFVSGDKEATNKINVGVILSGGQAPGGHNVISGIFDAV